MFLQSLRENPTFNVHRIAFFVGTPCHADGRAVDFEKSFKISGSEIAGSANVSMLGQACRIGEGQPKNGIVVLTPMLLRGEEQGCDYYFPVPRMGIGCVDVPKSASNGTIVITGAMNGCALRIYDTGINLTFMHDRNGSSLANMMGRAPNLAARFGHTSKKLLDLTYNDYAPGRKGESLSGPGKIFSYHLISVIIDKCIYVTSFGIITGQGDQPLSFFAEKPSPLTAFKAF